MAGSMPFELLLCVFIDAAMHKKSLYNKYTRTRCAYYVHIKNTTWRSFLLKEQGYTECKIKIVAKLQRAAELEVDRLCNMCYNQFPKEIFFLFWHCPFQCRKHSVLWCSRVTNNHIVALKSHSTPRIPMKLQTPQVCFVLEAQKLFRFCSWRAFATLSDKQHKRLGYYYIDINNSCKVFRSSCMRVCVWERVSAWCLCPLRSIALQL